MSRATQLRQVGPSDRAARLVGSVGSRSMTRLRFFRFSLLAAALCTIASLAAGCGASSSSLVGADAAKLHKDVASIRSAANARNPAAAHAAVRTLEADIAQLKAAGRLAPADASVLLSDAGQVDRRVSLEVRAPAASTRTSTTPTSPASTSPAPAAGPSPAPGAGHGPHGPGKDKGHGHGHGGGGGNGGD